MKRSETRRTEAFRGRMEHQSLMGHQAMSVDQLREELETARQNLFNLRFQWATAQIRDHNLLKAARRDVARLETILRARQLAGGEGE